MIFKSFRTPSRNDTIREFYGMIVAQARSPAFYEVYGVPDSVEGRFDMIVLHLVLVLARLNGAERGQKLFDAFCRDLDANLRKMGVGDLAVRKRMRRFGEAFYGRQAAYRAAFAAPDHRILVNVLARNIFPSSADDAGQVRLSTVQSARPSIEALNIDGDDWLDMAERKSEAPATPAWHVPVAIAEIAETGQHFDLVADAGVRSAVAQIAGLRELSRFEANFDVTRRGAGGLRVAGRVSATVGQVCVVTLDPVINEVEEVVDLVFMAPQPMPAGKDDAGEKEPRGLNWGDPEPLVGGSIDLGALATEFLILGIDPYPRKPGAVFEPPQAPGPEDGPFAALAKLTQR